MLSALFTAIFALELALNVLANWPARFATDGWNWITAAIVVLSFVALAVPAVPSWLVKLVRSVLVIRLFGRVSALQRTSAAVTASLVPMLANFVVILVVKGLCKSVPYSLHSLRFLTVSVLLIIKNLLCPSTPPLLCRGQLPSWAQGSSPTRPPMISAPSPAPSSRCSAPPPAITGRCRSRSSTRPAA